jgi:hypothetical protein
MAAGNSIQREPEMTTTTVTLKTIDVAFTHQRNRDALAQAWRDLASIIGHAAATSPDVTDGMPAGLVVHTENAEITVWEVLDQGVHAGFEMRVRPLGFSDDIATMLVGALFVPAAVAALDLVAAAAATS